MKMKTIDNKTLNKTKKFLKIEIVFDVGVKAINGYRSSITRSADIVMDWIDSMEFRLGLS